MLTISEELLEQILECAGRIVKAHNSGHLAGPGDSITITRMENLLKEAGRD
jgi:hypothetical protein